MKQLVLSISIILLASFSTSLALAKQNDCSHKDLAKFRSKGATMTQKAEFYSCLLDEKAYSASVPFLIYLVSTSNNSSFQEKYLSKILSDLPRNYEQNLFKKLKNKRLRVSSETKSNLMYYFALKSFDKGHFKTALSYLKQQAGTSFQKFPQSKFLKGVIYFQRNQINSSEAQFEYLVREKWNLEDKELKERLISSSYLNLARINTVREDYKEAISNYRKVSFRDSEWFDGLIEMSWIMLSKGDYEGAIGNAEFVRKSTNPYVYRPWVPVIQSIGLLKLCQFPESKKSLDSFKERYADSHNRIKKYIRKNLNKSWYSSVAHSLETKLTKASTKNTPSLVFYAAKNKKIIKLQEMINASIDEEEVLKSLKRKFKKKSGFAYHLISRKLNDMNRKISGLENTAGKNLKENINFYLEDHKKLQKIADIVDFEIFARSSNSITQRVAGAKFKDKMKKTKRKEASWTYVGEFWTDEVGKLRSFIKNKCIDKSYSVSKR